MEALFEISLTFIRWLQTTYPTLEGVMSVVSMLGTFELYLALIVFVYWDVDKSQGKRLAYLLALTNVVVNGGKHLLQQPRPYWLDADLQLLEEAEGYGVPSRSVSIVLVTFFYLASWIRQQWMWVTAFVLVILMGLSRVYLGQHFLHDVAAALLLGLLLLFGYWLWRTYAAKEFRELILGQRFWLTVGVPIVMGVAYSLTLFVLGEPNTSLSWSGFFPLAEAYSLEEMVSGLAILLGLGMGFVLEGSRVRYEVEAGWWQKAIRFVVGLACTLIILYGLRAAFAEITPENASLWMILPLRFIRYFATAIFASFYAPLLFIRMGLATAAPEPPIDVSISPYKSRSSS